MEELSEMACEACRAGAPLATREEMAAFLPQLPAWRLVDVDGVERIEREFEFRNFPEALAFTNRVGELAEEVNHHPMIRTEWGRVTVAWWTHKIRGLHRNDFIMARRTDEAFSAS